MKKPNLREIFSRRFTYSTDTFVRTFICSYFTVSVIKLWANSDEKLDYDNIAYLQADKDTKYLILHICAILGLMLLLTALEYFLPKWKTTPHIMVCSTLLLSFTLMLRCDKLQNYVYMAIIFVCALVLLYSTDKECFGFIKSDFHSGFMWGTVACAAIIFGFFTMSISVYRYLTFSAPNFDFGLFCNMFHNMKETGIPYSTCERDMLLSHFAVHFSPVYYLMLPFYFVFSSPVTLAVLQVVIIYIGIIPLVLIARHMGLSKKMTLVLSVIYAAYPAISSGCFYDLHENCFLVTFLLWTFYFFEKEKYIPMAIFTLLTLSIKEDAFIYILFFAIYVIFSRKKYKVGIPLAVFSVLYFVVVSHFMQKYGLGIMSNRYNNLIYNSDDGLIGALKTLILNPGYVLTQIFTTSASNTDKLLYLFQLFVPLAFLPFTTKKISRLILICPVLLNILTMYVYQPNIRFQYSFGISAFLFYISVLNLSELKPFPKKYMAQLSAVACVLLFTVVVIPRYTGYHETYKSNTEAYEEINYALHEVLPEDASVTCSTFFLAHIADRDVIYEVGYHKENGKYKTDTDFIVLDIRGGYKTSGLEQESYFLENGYEEYYTADNLVIILKKK